MDDGEMSRATGERMPGVFKNARRVLESGLKKKATPDEWIKEVALGLLAVETPVTRRATPPMCCRPARARYSSSPTSQTCLIFLRPTPAGTRSSPGR